MKNSLTEIPSELGSKLIDKLKTFKGAINYDGTASSQVVFLLANGETLRFAVSDDDCYEEEQKPVMMVDQYRGLAIQTKNGPLTDLGLKV